MTLAEPSAFRLLAPLPLPLPLPPPPAPAPPPPGGGVGVGLEGPGECGFEAMLEIAFKAPGMSLSIFIRSSVA